MKKLILIKLGGSLITDKTKPYTTRPETITRLFKEIKQALIKRPELYLVIGNGAGSFPHQSAKKYGTHLGFSDDIGKFGYCVVQNDAAKLNRIIVQECIDQNIPAVGLQPSAVIMAKNKKNYFQNFTVLKQLVKHKIIPILYGDPIMDTLINSTIFSTDKIMELVAREFLKKNEYQIEAMISVGNYAGVVDDKGSVIESITNENFADISKYFYDTKVTDVTGGMRGKVKELLRIAQLGCKSIILNGGVEGNLQNALLGKKTLGTTVSK